VSVIGMVSHLQHHTRYQTIGLTESGGYFYLNNASWRSVDRFVRQVVVPQGLYVNRVCAHAERRLFKCCTTENSRLIVMPRTLIASTVVLWSTKTISIDFVQSSVKLFPWPILQRKWTRFHITGFWILELWDTCRQRISPSGCQGW
jgi:hypothetical protein